MKKILLTGGNGFIGKNILESYLAQKYEIIAPRSFELNLIDTDGVDDFFKDKEFDAVLHCACKPGHRNAKDSSNLFYSNIRMFQNLERHKNKYGKFINLGSGAIYGMNFYQPKMKEEFAGTHIPEDEHGFCKYVMEKQISNLDNFVDLRVFGIFGKYEDYSIRFISNAICKTIFDLPVTLRQNRKFDYLFINDLMPILEFFIDNKVKHKSYNITPDSSIELLELANLVKIISNKNIEIQIAQEGLGIEYSGDNSRLKQEYKDLKFTDIKNSIKQLYSWYEAQKNKPDYNLLIIDK
jgi:GDP-L-fucose synthase